MGSSTRNPKGRNTTAIALAAIGLSLGILSLSLSYVLPFSELISLIFIPFLSALIVLKGDYKSVLLFLAGSIAICFIDMQGGFFEYLPSVIIGIGFGYSVKHFGLFYPSFFCLIIVSMLVNILMTYPIDFFYKIDMIQLYASLFKKTRADFTSSFPVFMLLISFIQSLITYIIIASEIKKIASDVTDDDEDTDFYFSLVINLLSLAGLGLALLIKNEGLGYLLSALLAVEGTIQMFLFYKSSLMKLTIIEGILSLLAGIAILIWAKTSLKFLFLLPFSVLECQLSLVMLKYSRNLPLEKNEQEKDLIKEIKEQNHD